MTYQQHTESALLTVSQSELTLLAEEIKHLRQDVNLLLEKSPKTVSAWIPPRELARLLGIKSQTVGMYRTRGRFRPSSIRTVTRGQRMDWEYHHKDAVEDITGAS